MFKKFFFSSIFQLVGAILFAFLFGGYLPLPLKSALYAISLSLTEVLVSALPFMIFSFIASTVLGFQGRALPYFLLLAGGLSLSNFSSAWIAYLFGHLQSVHLSPGLAGGHTGLVPLWSLKIPRIASNDQALALGVTAGCLLSFFHIERAAGFIQGCKKTFEFLLARVFVPLIPVLVLGSSLKFQSDGIMGEILSTYGSVFLMILLVEVGYLGGLSFLAAGATYLEWKRILKNLIVPIATGFSTMSSAMALPASLLAAEKNTKNPMVSKMVMPTTVNFHLIGDGIFIPLLAFAVTHSLGGVMPSFGHYLEFSIFFVLAKFSVAAVPGGGILVMLPLLEKYFSMSREALSLMTALYVLFDPIITACNVAGNGVFVIFFNRYVGTLEKFQTPAKVS
jgi:hypothetical protein